jgi:hypothetical protein
MPRLIGMFAPVEEVSNFGRELRALIVRVEANRDAHRCSRLAAPIFSVSVSTAQLRVERAVSRPRRLRKVSMAFPRWFSTGYCASGDPRRDAMPG